MRGTVEVPVGSDEETVVRAAAAEENVARLLVGRKIVKQVYVAGRIVNFVLGGPA